MTGAMMEYLLQKKEAYFPPSRYSKSFRRSHDIPKSLKFQDADNIHLSQRLKVWRTSWYPAECNNKPIDKNQKAQN